MIRRFWKTMFFLYIVTLLVSGLSVIALSDGHRQLVGPQSALQFLNLPDSFPTIGNLIQPAHLSNWEFPVLSLLVQAWVGGGYLGSMVRLNTLQGVSIASFIADAMRSFWRLLVWSFLLDVVALSLTSLAHLLPMLGSTEALVFLAVHYVFFFAPVGLVAEQAATMRAALATSVRALLNGFLPMLPYAGLMVLSTAAVFSLSTVLPWPWFLGLSALYLAVMTWLWHMVVARYVVFSHWRSAIMDGATLPQN